MGDIWKFEKKRGQLFELFFSVIRKAYVAIFFF